MCPPAESPPRRQRTETEKELAPVTESVMVLKLLFSVDKVRSVERPITSRGLQIGREVPASSDLCLAEDRLVSSVHARITQSASGCFIKDRGSKNGIHKNGHLIKEGPLIDGDVLRIGESLLLVRQEPPEIRDAPDEAVALHDTVLGSSPAVRELRFQLSLAASKPHSVLLTGPTGTGKDLAAKAIHELSRRKGAFIPVNCAGILESLAESLLFGHAAGAFNGAKKHPGFFAQAHEGTLFLDELGELPVNLQPKFLRAVEQREIWPIGASQPMACDVRFISATNRDLHADVEQARFRRDLHERLGTLIIDVPPLRARAEDILPLFLRHLGSRKLKARAGERLLVHPWPGNIRSLIRLAHSLNTFYPGSGVLDESQIAPYLGPVDGPASVEAPPPVAAPVAALDPKAPVQTKWTHHDFSRETLERALVESGGNQERAAGVLGVSRRTFKRWFVKLGLLDKDPK